MDTTPFWAESARQPAFAALDHDEHLDVMVVGGGITGLTAAYLLATEGRRVAVFERARCGEIDTGHTTAHLTMVTDTRLCELVRRHGHTHAQAIWDAGLAAIANIHAIVRRHGIDCDFAWVDGYLHCPDGRAGGDDAAAFYDEAKAARDLGFDAESIDDVPLVGGPGIRFDGQARFHPRKYLAGLARAIEAAGGRVYERSAVEAFRDDPLGATVNGFAVTCDEVIVATHNPLVGVSHLASATLFQTKLALYTTYAVAGLVPAGRVPDALWWDTANPYRYLRVQPAGDQDLVILGGEDHKTGQEPDTALRYATLEQALGARFPDATIASRWSGQVIETPDGLPYAGRMADHQYAATGFGGNGMTFGTLGAMICADHVLGRRNPWAELFEPERKALGRSTWEYIKENTDYPYYLVRDRFAGVEGRSLRAVRRGEGKIVDLDGTTVAAYRDDEGVVSLVSPTCTHMGCTVAWNRAERTWDCPCHGSRFTPYGHVISGPAESALAPVAPPEATKPPAPVRRTAATT